MSENMKTCSNCGAEIPESKFFLHEPFCIRNVKKCSICKEVIHIEEEEEHIQENHTEVPCKFCKKGIAKEKLKDHLTLCDQQPTECRYCNLGIVLKEKRDHEYVCGSKTEYCHNCKKYIAIKDFDVHQEFGCYPDEINLGDHLDVNRIPAQENRRNSKGGKIAAGKSGLLANNNNNDRDKDKDRSGNSITTAKKSEDKKDLHKELGEKIENLTKNEIKPKKEIENIITTKEKEKEKILPNKNKNMINFKEENREHSHIQPNKPKEVIMKNNINYKEMIKDSYFKENNNIGTTYQHITPTTNLGSGIHNVNSNFNHNPNRNVKVEVNQMHPSLNNAQHLKKENPNLIKMNNAKHFLQNNHDNMNSMNQPTTNKPSSLGNNHNPISSHKISTTNNKLIKEKENVNLPPSKEVKKMPYTKQSAPSNFIDHSSHKNEKPMIPKEKEKPIIKPNTNTNNNNPNKISNNSKETVIPSSTSDKNANVNKKASSNSKKDKFDPHKFFDDFLPDDLIEENYHHNDLYNKKHDIKDKQPSSVSVEDEILKQVLEMSKHTK